jgi:small subunit ribosomal protein S1
LRRYLKELSWKKLEALQKEKENISVLVQETTKAGFVLLTDFGVSGFLPQSHVSFSHHAEIVPGKTITVTVFELNKQENKVIFSQKTNLSDEEFVKAIKVLHLGDKVKATISNISPFGLYVTFTVKDVSLEGFVHISEIAWDKVEDLSSLFRVGQVLEVSLIRFDTETKRINCSIKRLTVDPFETVIEKYSLDKKVKGEIIAIDDTGVTLSLDEEIKGFIKQEKIPPTTKYTVGQEITASISEHDKKRHKIILVPVLLEKPIGYR